MRLLSIFLLALSLTAAERKAIFPPGVKPVGPYSPGILAGDYLYVSGQGARDASGQLPDGIAAQTEQCVKNIQTIVEAAGLTLEHVVYTQAYLSDMANYDAFNGVYMRHFGKAAPARSLTGVTRMPTDTPVEISAVAVRDLSQRKAMPAIANLAVLTADRLFVSGILGKDADTNKLPADPRKQVEMALSRVLATVKACRLKAGDVKAATVYVTPQIGPPIAQEMVQKQMKGASVTVVPVNVLPLGANVEITAIAATRPLDTVYLAGRTGATAAILEELKAKLTAAGMSADNVVAANVYIDDINQFAAMNSVYAGFFSSNPPTRTTVQPTPVAAGKQNTISLIAVK
ncbi:MAG TPA: RidA family protein [Bryobacteraceae bacterium]|nr:RidA family protein [Bryobacteraceae bacterium]